MDCANSEIRKRGGGGIGLSIDRDIIHADSDILGIYYIISKVFGE
jgi:hypothetical protein